MIRKNKFQFLSVISLLIISIFWACSEDSPTENSTAEGGNVYRYQAVTVDAVTADLSVSEYDATFGNVAVKVIRLDDSTLGFAVPSTASLGNTTLTIPSIGITVNYNVLQPVLPQSADEIISQFTSLGDTYIANQTVQDPNNNYLRFKDYYANHATPDQKEKIALCYYVNKQAFDSLITFDPGNASGRYTFEHALLVGKFLVAVAGGGVSIWIMYSQIPADPAGAILAGAATYFFYTKAKVLGEQIVDLSDIKTTGLNLGGISGQNARMTANNTLSMTDDVAVELPFQLSERALTMGDSNTSNETVANFFDKLAFLNDFISKTNTAIAWINNNVPFVNFTPFEAVTLQTNPSTVANAVDAPAMQNISFSVTHPNLQLVNASLAGNGQLSLKVKVIGTPTTTPVASTLQYIYDDGLSSFQGSFNIEVETEPMISLIGTWQIIGYGTGEYDAATNTYSSYVTSENGSNQCSNGYTGNYTTTMSPTNLVFTENSLSMGYSTQTAGQFCDGSFGETQCSYFKGYTFTATLTPSMPFNNLKNVLSNYTEQVTESCTPFLDNTGQPCTIPDDPYCEGYSLNENNSDTTILRIYSKDSENTIYIVHGGQQLKAVRQ